MMINLLNRFKPDSVVIAWDVGRSKPRQELYPEYKAQRSKNRKPEDDEAIKENLKIAQSLFASLPVKQIMIDGVEADDILGFLSHRIKSGKRILVSNDRDFLQLVQKDVFVFLPSKNKLIGTKNVEEELGVPVDKYLLWKALVGDSSDNIKGIAGIGEKRATALINEDGVIKKEWLPVIERNLELMNIGLVLTQANLDEIKALYALEKNKKPDIKKVRAIMAKYEFNSLLNSFYRVTNAFKPLIKKG